MLWRVYIPGTTPKSEDAEEIEFELIETLLYFRKPIDYIASMEKIRSNL